MVDAVTVDKVYGPDTAAAGRGRYVYHLTNISDGTGEADVAKVDISTLFAPPERNNVAVVPTYTNIEAITWSVSGSGYVLLEWDGTADDTIAVLTGEGQINWLPVGGKVDPQSAGGTGDILLSFVGPASGDGYDITIWFRTKS